MTLPPPLDDLLSAAVVAYLEWGRAPMPAADEGVVTDLAQREGADPTALLRGVHEAIGASDRLEVTDLSASDDSGAALYKQRLRAARPDLSPDAVDALASRWFFNLRWLGVESGIDVPLYFVRYGGEGATPIPISLFRRRTVEGGHVDEVLRDVGNWQPDSRRGIANALAFPLESDLEEVTADEAAQFEEMVRARRYVPFRSSTGVAAWHEQARRETPLFEASMVSEQTIPASRVLSAVDELARLAPDVIRVTRTDTAVVVQADELTFRVTPVGRTWRVRKSWRSQDRGVAFETSDETDIGRFLIAMLTNDIRRARGLVPRRRAVTLSDEGLAQPAASFTISGSPDAGFVLTDTYRQIRWRFASDLDAVRFSWIAPLAWTDIRAEFGRSGEAP